jgi:ligand-binding sensor domain-containing protein
VLYVGTDFGVYVSTNGGSKWDVLGNNLPSVQVSDLQIDAKNDIVVISTYGRGMWAFDVSRVK